MSFVGYEILIVDDDDDFRLIIRKILENLGVNVVEASSVLEGLDLLKERFNRELSSPSKWIVENACMTSSIKSFFRKFEINSKVPK